MADVVRVNAAELARAAALVAEHIETAAQPAAAAIPSHAVASPVDAAASSAAEAIHTKMAALSAEMAPKGPTIHAAGMTAAASLQAQDTANAARLPSVPSPSAPSVRAMDHGWKRDPPPPPPGDPGRHRSYSDHKPDGTWARGNSGVEGYPEEQEEFNKREARTGIPIERQKIRVTLIDPKSGETLRREYDGLEPIPGHPGEYRGLEHKLGSKDPTDHQELFDGYVKGGIPAEGTLNGKPIRVTDTETIRTPRDPVDSGPDASPIISPPPNLPAIGDHPSSPLRPTLLDHPPNTALPPQVLDHPPLPPWLQDPSPPGFHVSSSEPPSIAPFDSPGELPPVPHHDPPFQLRLPDLHMPDLGLTSEQLRALENELGVDSILGLILVGGALVAVG